MEFNCGYKLKSSLVKKPSERCLESFNVLL